VQPDYKSVKVSENVQVSKDIYKLTIEGSFIANPGQFYMLRCWENEPLLSRPISIHEINGGSITFLYEVKGNGTKFLSMLKSGDTLNMLGPLGNGFDIENIKGKVAIVAGGIGIAAMLYTAKTLKGREIDLYAGFRDDVYIVDNFKDYTSNIYITTDSGRAGHKGFITDIFNPEGYSVVLCCGPEIMMEKVVKKCLESDIQIYVSMENIMACGVGACLVCTCKTDGGNKRVCKDGPVFSGGEVIFNA